MKPKRGKGSLLIIGTSLAAIGTGALVGFGVFLEYASYTWTPTMGRWIDAYFVCMELVVAAGVIVMVITAFSRRRTSVEKMAIIIGATVMAFLNIAIVFGV